MAAKSKTVSVTKRPSAEQIVEHQRWNAFVTASQVEWDDLSEDWKDFFEVVGSTKSSSEEINQAIMKAMTGDLK